MNSKNGLSRIKATRWEMGAARNTLLFVTILVAGCAATAEQEADVARNGPIDDFIVISGLEKTHSLKPIGSLRNQPLTLRHIILRDRRNTYLIEFGRPCKALDERDVPTQNVPNPGRFKVPVDAYRGCSFRSVYPLNDEQEKELLELVEKLRR